MPILNYTTSIEASKTVSEIQNILSKHGAKSCLMNYDNEGNIESLSFTVLSPVGELGIVLSVNPNAVLKLLENSRVEKRYRNKTQAIRISWRIIKNWIEAQMAMLDTEMVKMEQIFLPYMITKDGRTVYELISDSKFLLNEGKQS